MPAPIGNKNAIGNEGGRPPIYDASNPEDIDKVKLLSVDYFEYIKGEFTEDEEEDSDGEKIVTQKWVRHPEPPTVTGLTLHLGFESKNTLYEYAKKVEFSDSIKKALTKIEQFHEIRTSHGDKCTGNIFILKNFGWEDRTQQEHSGGINLTPPTIRFIDTDGD